MSDVTATTSDAANIIERFLWRSIADMAGCTCVRRFRSRTVCPECQAWRFLGLGDQWPGPHEAGAVLLKAGTP